jgi:hypothetical protein
MIRQMSARSYIDLLCSSIQRCSSIADTDRTIPVRAVTGSRAFLLCRGVCGGGAAGLFEGDAVASRSIQLARGGTIDLFLRLRELDSQRIEVASYNVVFRSLPSSGNPNSLHSLRYDKAGGKPRGLGWDDDLADNPQHPWAHLHINFDVSGTANDCRMATASTCPILIIKAFDHWYYSTFCT